MATIAKLSVQIVANAQQLLSALPSIGEKIQRVGARISGISGAFAKFSRGTASHISEVFQAPLQSLEKLLKAIPVVGEALALIPAAAGSGFASVMGWFKSGSENILALNSAAIQLNTTIEDIQPVLTLAGDGAEAASKGLFHMQRTIAEAAAGSEEAQKKLAHLGLTAAELGGKSTSEQFGMIADRLNATNTAGEKAAYGMEIFSKSASGLNKIIRRGSAGLESFRQKMEAGGMNFSSRQAAMVKQATLALKQFDRSLLAIKTNLAIVLSPIIEGISNQFGKLRLSSEGLQTWLLKLAKTIAVFGVFAKSIFTPWRILKDGQAITAFFRNVKEQIEDARRSANKSEAPGNFLQSFIEHAEELTNKLRDQTNAYGRNSAALELNRLAREKAASVANMRMQIQQMPGEHKKQKDAIRKLIEDAEKAREVAVDKYAWSKVQTLDAKIETLKRQLKQLDEGQALERAEREKDLKSAQEQADAIYKVASARTAELESLDKITSSAVPALNIYQEYYTRLSNLETAFASGKISAEGLAGGMRKIEEALEKAEASKIVEIVKQAWSPLESMRGQMDLLNEMLRRGAIGWETWSRAAGKAIIDGHKEDEMLLGTMNPLEKFNDKIAELNELLDAGSIKWETYQRAVFGASNQLIELHKSEKRMTGAVEFGSQEAYKIVNHNLLNPRKSKDERLRDAMKEQIQIQKDQKKDLDILANAARRGFLAVGRIGG